MDAEINKENTGMKAPEETKVYGCTSCKMDNTQATSADIARL